MIALLTKSPTTLAIGAALLLSMQNASAVPCIGGGVNDTESATANGSYADACHYYNESNIANPSDITSHTNNLWGDSNPFTYIGKFNKGSGAESGDLAGFTLSAFSPGENGFGFGYELTVPESLKNTTVDWVLGVKQSNNSYMSYLFTDITLGIEGGFSNFWLNPNGEGQNDYSFIAGFIRKADVPVPEPGSIALLGLGLAGLSLARRRSARN